MSDELRDLLRSRAEAIDVPSGSVTAVVRGGRVIQARRYAFAALASVVLIAVVTWTVTGDGVMHQFTTQPLNPGPTADPLPSPPEGHVVGACASVPFRPGYLPEGWSYVLKEG